MGGVITGWMVGRTMGLKVLHPRRDGQDCHSMYVVSRRITMVGSSSIQRQDTCATLVLMEIVDIRISILLFQSNASECILSIQYRRSRVGNFSNLQYHLSSMLFRNPSTYSQLVIFKSFKSLQCLNMNPRTPEKNITTTAIAISYNMILTLKQKIALTDTFF